MTVQRKLGTGIVSLVVILIGLGVLLNTWLTPASPVHSTIGPKIFPYAFGTLLAALGVFLAKDAWTNRWECEANDPQEPASDLGALAWVVAGLVLNLLLIKVIGFILSSTLMYAMVARGFGVRRIWFAAACGFILAMIAYFGFAELLGLRMGNGLIEDLF